MMTESLILNLLTILTVAWLLGYLFSRFGMPLMLGQLLAGVILGPPLLTQQQFSALIIMAFITTSLAPITLKFALQRSCQPDEYSNFCRILSETSPR